MSTDATDVCVRDATDSDAPQIREIYQATYGADYAHPQYYDEQLLKKAAFADDNILLVAEQQSTGKIVGTASVLLDVGAFGDLAGEFGRLAVHPDARHCGIGRLLMEGRLARVANRLHVGIVDNRVAHSYSQRISLSERFVPVGFVPQKLLLARRESVAVFIRHFDDALSLRRNNPRLIPEAYELAEIALPNCGLPCGAVIDDTSAPYPGGTEYKLDELTTRGYATLLRFERGRVSHRDIFGPVRLHYGLFKLRSANSNYLLARETDGRLCGAIGFTIDRVEKAVRVFELISRHDRSIRFLLERLVQYCGSQWDIAYLEADVSAFAPRMQRTLLELDFLPTAYLPAMVFHEVERLDTVKMVRLLAPYGSETTDLVDCVQPLADIVSRHFRDRMVSPRVVQFADSVSLFADLNAEQTRRLAAAGQVQVFAPGQQIFAENQRDGKTYAILRGRVAVSLSSSAEPVGEIGAGECLGEMSLLCGAPHSATATAIGETEAAVLSQDDLQRLVRRRPDIGVAVYRNLAVGIGEKLWRSDQRLVGRE